MNGLLLYLILVVVAADFSTHFVAVEYSLMAAVCLGLWGLATWMWADGPGWMAGEDLQE